MENSEYVVEMLNITKRFKGIVANDNITIQLKRGEIHALLGENGAGKSTLMSVLFGLYKQEEGIIKVNGKEVNIYNPNTANELGIGMVHQHFKLVHNFTALENIMLGVETVKHGILQVDDARKKVMELSKTYGLEIYPDSLISDLTVGMQQRVEILKMLYRNNNILIFDEPTAVLTPNEIEELMKIMKSLVKEGKSILFITHKLNEIKEVADRCSVLRKGKYIGTIDVKSTTKEEMSEMMVGRKVSLVVEKTEAKPKDIILSVKNLNVKSLNNKSEKNLVKNVSFDVHSGEIVCIAGIDGNGQSELIYALTGLMEMSSGTVTLNGKDITNLSIRKKTLSGIGHIPEDRHKHGLVLDYTLAENTILQTYFTDSFQKNGFLKFKEINNYADELIKRFDIRSAEGSKTIARSMSGGNQQKIIIAREIDRNPDLLIAVQPTRGLDVGAIEYIHKELIFQRDNGKAILLVSLELDEVMNLSDRILVIYEGEIVANVLNKDLTINELGLYMAGSKRSA
ncbi:ABC transporter ATP-binding protein [Brachyspira sp. G79]|uniref:ABC transporter ATP-binding protein n=1 Tax=Brachyspira sp. G79 TaxID=1358104 RepID=UPI000BBBD9B3|nr:ABC transporter ATP-binding protein [Brachyspira sp. G79]PCG21047.1 heme ABC transporter ATP-binding protein [Brachyspira sp. G79]